MPKLLAPLEESEFLLWQRLIEEKTGLWLPKARLSFVQAQLSSRVLALGLRDYRAYYDALANERLPKEEWATLVDKLTVHETRFFRDPDAMALVSNYCRTLIETTLVQRKSLRSSAARQILADKPCHPLMFQLWSVGCSTGEEVYSLAMTLDTLAKNSDVPLHYGVTGSDISLPSIRQAREGCYAESAVRDLPDAYKAEYFIREGLRHWVVSPELKQRVYFTHFNLSEIAASPQSAYNVIYCQNVLIYFKPERREQILDELVKRLVPGGLLVLAPGEAGRWSNAYVSRYPHDKCLAYLRKSG